MVLFESASLLISFHSPHVYLKCCSSALDYFKVCQNFSMGDISTAAPRVNFEQLQRFIGKRVRLMGQIERVEGNAAYVKAADGGVVTVVLKSSNSIGETPYVEIDGVVDSPTTVRELDHSNFGSSFGTCPATGHGLSTIEPSIVIIVFSL